MTEVNLLLKWRFLGPQGIEPTTFNIDKINNKAFPGKRSGSGGTFWSVKNER